MGDSTLFPIFVLLAIFAFLAGFFRKLLVKVVVILVVEVALFVLFPNLLVKLAQLVEWTRNSIG